jgi:NAD-dependent SIR2 family protein deacetylase/SAM-dependent methyltransferase
LIFYYAKNIENKNKRNTSMYENDIIKQDSPENPEEPEQAKEIRNENLLLNAPDLIAPEKISEELDSMTFRFSSDNRQYTLLQSKIGSAVLVECYDVLPDELTESEKSKFTKEKKIIDGVEHNVFVLPSRNFEELVRTDSNEPKEYVITEKRDFQLSGFKKFLSNNDNRIVLTEIISSNTKLESKRAQEIADRIFDAEIKGDKELRKKNLGLLDRESFEKMRVEVLKKIEMPNPSEITIEDLAAILKNKRILFYTGAGISAGAGVHDMQKLKKTLQIDQSQLSDGFLKIAANDPEEAVELWNEFTQAALNKEPTQAHIVLTKLSKKLQCRIFTENVDHLHEKTGIFAERPTGDWLKENIQKEWLKDVDVIVTVGLNSDDRAFLAWYKENNFGGKIVAINLDQPRYLGDEDYLLKGDLQDIIPKLDVNASAKQETANNTTDWKEIWKELQLNSPTRKEVFPDGGDEKMSDNEIIEKLNAFLKERNFEQDNYSGIDAEEFPEIIDEDIRDICVKLNKISFLKTKEGCGGHEYYRSTGEAYKEGYADPYLIMLIDERDVASNIFLQQLSEKFEEFKNSNISGIENSKLESYNEPLAVQGFGMYRYSMAIAPSKKWCAEHNKEYIEYPKQLGFFPDWCSENGYEYSDEEGSESRIKWEEAKDMFILEMEKFSKEYFDYFRSPEVKNLRDEFFEVFDKARASIENREEDKLVDDSFSIDDPKRWIKLVESESANVVRQYFNNLGLTKEMIAKKAQVLDIGAGMRDFAAFCIKEKINDTIVSLEPNLDDNLGVGITEAVKIHWGEDVYNKIQNNTIRGVVEHLPFKDGSFEMIVDHAAMPGFNYSINEVEQMKKGIHVGFDEIIRVLRPGGEARLFPLADKSDERWSEWRLAVDEKLAEMTSIGKCSVFIESVIDSESGQLMQEKRLILKKNL